jgi:hypothetical protein
MGLPSCCCCCLLQVTAAATHVFSPRTDFALDEQLSVNTSQRLCYRDRTATGKATDFRVLALRVSQRHPVRETRRAGMRHTSVYVSIRQHTSAYVSIRQHTSAYVSIRMHSCLRNGVTSHLCHSPVCERSSHHRECLTTSSLTSASLPFVFAGLPAQKFAKWNYFSEMHSKLSHASPEPRSHLSRRVTSEVSFKILSALFSLTFF